jgi:hypothetical protein
MKITLCLLRKIRHKDDGYNSYISGFLAGLTLAVNNDRDFRISMGCWLLVRSAEALFNLMESKGYITSIKYGDILLWAIYQGFMIYANIVDKVPNFLIDFAFNQWTSPSPINIK